jgi:hypothetical protein
MSGRSSFNRLADVEIQLVLQCLDRRSRVAAAGMSKRIFAAAKNPFVWLHAHPSEMIIVKTSELPLSDPAAAASSSSSSSSWSLRRFVPRRLKVNSRLSDGWTAHLPSLVQTVGVAPLHAVANPACWVKFQEWAELLGTPSLHQLVWNQLRSMTFAWQIHLLPAQFRATLDCIVALPHLTHLSIFPAEIQCSPDALLPLSRAPALTDLEVSFGRMFGTGHGHIALPALRHIQGLKRLHFRSATFDERDVLPPDHSDSSNSDPAVPSSREWCTFRSFFECPSIAANLEHLSFSSLHGSCPADRTTAPELLAARYEHAFAALKNLRTLELEAVSGIDDMLPHLHHAPVLRHLTLHLHPENPCNRLQMGSRIPTAGVLSAVLSAVPTLCVTLRSPPEPEWGATRLWNTPADQWVEVCTLMQLERVTTIIV